ncbi:MAG: hypothetical protein AB7U46_17395 [Paenirhodobacter sp.]|jgi:hypothetical protein|uniref:hypothetical protein n=1 Tax=Paenirhodobacter sp. TaxID=1965326 RepID=UPI003D1498FC
MTAQTDLFLRLVQGHKPDCALSFAGTAPAAVACPEVLAATLGSEALARYAEACRPVYEDLRRIIGQISGLLILAQLTAQREIRDLPEYGACTARMAQAQARLEALSAGSEAQAHKDQLLAALAFSRLAMGTFSGRAAGDAGDADLDRAGLQIKRAYAHLQAASAQRAGLEMVDLSLACCCGAH